MGNSVPKEVINGFAEYGANFFALYDYSNKNLDDGIFCISESPFSLKLATQWTDTPKAGILKKLETINGKAATIAQTLTGKDYDVVLAGDATYVRYAGVERMRYSTQVTTLTQSYYTETNARVKLSNASEIETFLTSNGLPYVNGSVIATVVNNALTLPVGLAEKVMDISNTIKNTDSETLDVTTALATVSTMIKTATAIQENIKIKLNEFAAALNAYVKENFKNKQAVRTTGGQVTRTITTNELVVGNPSSINQEPPPEYTNELTASWIDSKGNARTIVTIKHLRKKLSELQDDVNSPSAEDIKKVKNFKENEWKKKNKVNFESGWKDTIIKSLISENTDDKDNKKSGLSMFLSSWEQKIHDEYESATKQSVHNEQVVQRDLTKVKMSKNAVATIVDGLLNLGDDHLYGSFDHRIKPCVLFYSLAGRIIKDHVLISDWSETENTWGFTNTFSISMEKAEIDTWKNFQEHRMISA